MKRDRCHRPLSMLAIINHFSEERRIPEVVRDDELSISGKW